MSDLVVEACGLTKTYGAGTRALDRVDLRVATGEWIAVMGPSGSGKTTLLNLLSCLDRPSGGTLTIDGVDVSGLDGKAIAHFRREKVGLVFQQFHLVPYLTALEKVMLAQYFHSLVDEDEAREALERVGLGERLAHLPSQLSGGEQQRVCIARALINQPKLVLADEPTGNLDQENEELVMRIFSELHGSGHTIVMVTHDPDIGSAADRVVRLYHGRVATHDGGNGVANELAKLLPDEAERITDGRVETVPVPALRVGDLVLVRPGGQVPADGEVQQGESQVNESMITGESRPVGKAPGGQVVAGTVNGSGSPRVRVNRIGDDTMLAGVLRLVSEAQSSRSRAQDLADMAAYWLTLVAIGVAVVTLAAWGTVRGLDNYTLERGSRCWWSRAPTLWGWPSPW